jgi:hypothetical protein
MSDLVALADQRFADHELVYRGHEACPPVLSFNAPRHIGRVRKKLSLLTASDLGPVGQIERFSPRA